VTDLNSAVRWRELVMLVQRDYPAPALDALGSEPSPLVYATLTASDLTLSTTDAEPATLLVIPTSELQYVALEGYIPQQHYVTFRAFVGYQPGTVAPQSATRIVIRAKAGTLTLGLQGAPNEVAMRAAPLLQHTWPQPTPRVVTPAGLSEQLAGLARLHGDGVLTPAEFAAAKRKLLGLPAPPA
jgi:hypothetical protein